MGLDVFLSLGISALANRLPSRDELEFDEPQFPLDVAFCPACALVQLTHVVPPALMFKQYLYVSSTTRTFREHFRKMADDIVARFALDRSSTTVDIGSNDGLLLKGFQRHGVRTVGVEPADNIAALAREAGVPTITGFFDADIANRIVNDHGRVDVVTANNVFAHIDDIRDVVRNVDRLLRDDGVFVIEFAYLFDMLEQLTFDLIYHEHVSYYSLTPLVSFFASLGMDVIRAERVATHGGSLRVYVQRGGARHNRDDSVVRLLDEERGRGVTELATYQAFAARVYDVRKELVEFFQQAAAERARVAGFGMPAKATTLLTFCGITRDEIAYIVDDNPLKQGRFTPVGHVPIVSADRLRSDPPDYVVIFAWNFADEILKTIRAALPSARFVVPLPTPRVVAGRSA